MNQEQHLSLIEQHCKAYFKGHKCSSHQWSLGPLQDLAPWFHVLRFAPGPRTDLWVYISVGASLLGSSPGSGIEFSVTSPQESSRIVELLAMSAYYHKNHRLGLEHTLPIGESWLDGSVCDHLLVSLPYPFGPELEICSMGQSHAHIYWLLPITKAERDFKVEHGLEALEQKFESLPLEYWRSDRESAV